MTQLFNDIKTKILEVVPEVTFVQMYNGQFEDIEAEGAAIYSFPSPFVLIEFEDNIEWKQLGQGYQIADPLFVNLHLGHVLYDAQDGTMELNLEVYNLSQKLFKGMNKFEPAGAVQFIRKENTQDKRHTNLYHFIQRYATNYIDQDRTEPVNGILKDPPTGLEINGSYEIAPYTKKL